MFEADITFAFFFDGSSNLLMGGLSKEETPISEGGADNKYKVPNGI